MNNQKALEYINSSEIREHLRKLDYQLTPVQCAFLVWQSQRHTLNQKHDAWRDIIETMPDCAVEERSNWRGWDSLHAMLRGYMALDEKILSRFRSGEDRAVYECEFRERSIIKLKAKDAPRGNEYEWREDGRRFRSLGPCFEYAMKEAQEEACRFRIIKRYLDTPTDLCCEPYISVEYDTPGEMLDYNDVGSSEFYALSEEEEDLRSESFDGMWFDIPIPFEKGDIVCDNACIYTKGVPFVLRGTVPWYKKEHPSPRGTYYCDYSDMNAYGYSYDFDRQLFNDDFRVDYLNLEYFTEPLKGPERLLYAYRQLERQEIDGYILLKIYRMLMAEAAEEEERRDLQWCLPKPEWEKYCRDTKGEGEKNGRQADS